MIKKEARRETWQKSSVFFIAGDLSKLKIAVDEACKCKTQGEAAEVYCSYGIPVFPCEWRPEKQKDGSFKLNKRPLRELGEGGLYLASASQEVARLRWTQWPEALIGVPGGRRTGIWFLDIDTKDGHGVDGLEAWERLKQEYGPVDTRSHITGSKGFHEIWLWDPDRPVECKTGRLPEGMDVKGEGGYVIFPPSPYTINEESFSYGVANNCDPVAGPDWLYDLIRPKKSKGDGHYTDPGSGFNWSSGFGSKKLKECCELVQTAQQHHWDEACRKVFYFGRLCGGGAYDPGEALKKLLEAAEANTSAPDDYKVRRGDTPSNVERAFLKGVADPSGPFADDASLEDFCAYLPQHNYIFIPTRELWPAASINATIPSVDKDLKASLWLDQNRGVDQMTWAPGEEMVIHDRLVADGGWFDKPGKAAFNLYKPPIIEPGESSKAGPWIDLVRKVYPDDAEHMFKWWAQRVQQPGIKINHCILMIGAPGIGKDTMLEPVKYAVGAWNFHEVSPQTLLGRFNGWLQSVILRVSEARDLGEMNRYAFYEHTKTLAASPPDALMVDEKNLREHYVPNCVSVVITSNYLTGGIYLPDDDRRHYVAWSSLTNADFEEGYWSRLWQWYEEEGYRHVAAFLHEYDISKFNPKAPPIKTTAFWQIVEVKQGSRKCRVGRYYR